MMWIIPVSSKGQVTLPIGLRQALGLRAGFSRVVLKMKSNQAILRPTTGTLADLKGVLSGHPKSGIPWSTVRKQARYARALHIARNG